MTLRKCNSLPIPFQGHSLFMGPNRRAQERERAAARAAAEGRRAEAARKSIADAQKIVAIWNARQAGGRGALVLPDDRRRDRGRRPVAHRLVPGVPASRLARPSHARSAPGRGDFKLDPVSVLP